MTTPVIRFDGSDSARMMNAVVSENLNDLVKKVDKGSLKYPAGFFHTSTFQHPGTCYYDDIWSRDGGRGLIELAKYGYVEEAELVAGYFCDNLNHTDHWGRRLDSYDRCQYEIDGNALALLGLYHTYNISRDQELKSAIEQCMIKVFGWVAKECSDSPYGNLLPCQSELSGNPNTTYRVYGVFPNYAMAVALVGVERVLSVNYPDLARRAANCSRGIFASIDKYLVSDGKTSNAPEGTWFNGIDARDGSAYDFSDWDRTSWPIYHWTRQVPYILLSDIESLDLEASPNKGVERATFEYLLGEMAKSRFFRRYGFVSNTAWTGTGGRHDDTMFGYGQSFFTQAALLLDNVNVASLCLEGAARLAYDGEIATPLTWDSNPWLFHECYNYRNYEEGHDHSYGVMSHGRVGIMDNPGDEGNLVQAAEFLKAFRLVIGIDDNNTNQIRLMPRLPWRWDSLSVHDYPIRTTKGLQRCSFQYHLDRSARMAVLRVSSGSHGINAVRLGPFPRLAVGRGSTNLTWSSNDQGSWCWADVTDRDEIHVEVKLE